ncbi:electron transfer flavoprotein-ubiquinone oxidoreductase [Methylomonas sp. SURF-2]|uniref:Electron transfer flavoprotein-ubiquinone oxidoreductase n=1 Tax=Methylomonas subterranea TaxID=2952225 RepID=A0ABT1TIU5_9GAMM|nr:electron transfer flavoprotein-ubiquinone oxidoreductase [Methylomonas sp. SURF-2]MCQ8105396.1 electron transfer flavoprotein-ubiquinone oxidoreductase [Methylomonas sp. SURF-2]
MERESVAFDVAIVGAGPAGLAAAIKIKQLAGERGLDVSVCVLEKGSEVGAHILSGALLEIKALEALFPAWRDLQAPVGVTVAEEELCYLAGSQHAVKFPDFAVPKPLRNHGHYVVSLANLCRWLGKQAEGLGVDIFAGFAADSLLYREDGGIAGVVTGDMGLDKQGRQKPGFQAGIEVRAKYTLFAEGCHGHLGKQLTERYCLREGADPQHYGIGIKEVWKIDAAKHRPGNVLHTFGWPLDGSSEGGGFLYHLDGQQVALGFIVGLNYANPHLNPYQEMQRWKLHAKIKPLLEGGTRLAYGARALNKGGWQSLPRMSFPGGLLLGCDAGLLNPAKLRGIHNALRSGMLAAETVLESFAAGDGAELDNFEQKFRASPIYSELYQARNVAPALSKWGPLLGGAFFWLDQNLLAGRLPFTLRKPRADHAVLKAAAACPPIDYPCPDGKISFDLMASVALSNTHHEADQPCHLQLRDADVPLAVNWPQYAEPAQRYCPAKVYEVVADANGNRGLVINAQNCVHCKTCDIKDPAQNIDWRPPEGGGGPNYTNM